MTNAKKATCILAIIIEDLNLPKGATIGDVAQALSIIDPSDEIMNLLKPIIRNAVIDEIQQKIA